VKEEFGERGPWGLRGAGGGEDIFSVGWAGGGTWGLVWAGKIGVGQNNQTKTEKGPTACYGRGDKKKRFKGGAFLGWGFAFFATRHLKGYSIGGGFVAKGGGVPLIWAGELGEARLLWPGEKNKTVRKGGFRGICRGVPRLVPLAGRNRRGKNL